MNNKSNTIILPKWLDHTTWESPRWKTAIARNDLSMPMRSVLERKTINQSTTVLDFGCGRGSDVEFLQQQGISAIGFDPYWNYCPAELEITDIVSCLYVLNVIESPQERLEVMQFCWQLTRKTLVIAVRTEKKESGFTSIGTFQEYYTMATLAELIVAALGVQPVMIKKGVAVINK